MNPMLDEREREMYRLRMVEGLTLREIAQRFGIGPERVRQILNQYVRQTTGRPVDAKAMSRAASAVRRAKDLACAQAQAEQLLAAWRDGQEPERIARAFGLRCRSVAQVIRANRTAADRSARIRARRTAGQRT